MGHILCNSPNKKCMDSEAQKDKKTKIYVEKNINDPNSQNMKVFPNLPIICFK